MDGMAPPIVDQQFWPTGVVSQVALQTNSLIIHDRDPHPDRSVDGSSDISKYLALGVMVKPGGDRVQKIGDDHPVQLLGVQVEGAKENVEKKEGSFFTHQLLLKQARGPVLPVLWQCLIRQMYPARRHSNISPHVSHPLEFMRGSVHHEA